MMAVCARMMRRRLTNVVRLRTSASTVAMNSSLRTCRGVGEADATAHG